MSIVGAESDSWVGSTLTDRKHHKLGTIEEIYLDEGDGRPLWMVVRTRRFGARHCFVPIDDAVRSGDAVVTSYDRSLIERSPRLETAEDLPDDQVQQLYDHYGVQYRAHDEVVSPVERVLMYLA
jgi:hypothetical protein